MKPATTTQRKRVSTEDALALWRQYRATGGSLPPAEFERLLEGLAATTGAAGVAA